MKRLLYSGAMLLLCGAAYAQLYKSVGPDGKVTYSDTPPSAAARVETRPLAAGGSGSAGFPYELAEAARAHPVTLYTRSDCPPCDDGRRLLQQRGIPFSEKTVASAEDIALLSQAGGDTGLPQLAIGRDRERGFEAGAWNSRLSAAGYPESSKLPRGYRNPAPQSLATPKPQEAARNEQAARPAAEASAPTALPPAIGKAPPGFRF
jgi:glutaredoxin